ncbi:cytochrome P450 family protein [Singulisphaera sp. PoT]|uniref:cytochrome P450 family protein n=1 Tax=Singulisphaera sp. PoT TaxID=3411797 RepID=UPI003BF49316
MGIFGAKREAEFDLNSQAFKRDPFPTLARMRKSGPLIRIRIPIFGKVWMATTYESVNELLRDHARFVQSPATAGNRGVGTLLRWLPRTLRPLTTNMLLRDEPDHRRLRSLVDQAFRRQSVEALRPRLEALADAAARRPGSRGGALPDGVDLLAHFARPFPLAVICEILGLPPEDRPRFTGWASNLATATSLPSLLLALHRGVRPLLSYAREELRRQSTEPREGLIAALFQAEEAGDRLTEDEVVAMIFLLLAAGHETTLHQITLNVLTLLDHPEQLDALKADWSLGDSAAQELLRFVSFAQISKPRYAREPLEFQGRSIHRGEMLFACLASANADPSVFAAPDRLDLRRHPNRHVAFGTGIHHCLGAALARAETAIALERLFTRHPRLRLAVPPEALRFSPRIGSRSLLALPVLLG